MIARILPPPAEPGDDARHRTRDAALQTAWAELDAAHQLLTEAGAPPGLLAQRLRWVLGPQTATVSGAALDLLDSLNGCALTVQQLCDDTGRPIAGVRAALERLYQRRLVSRDRVVRPGRSGFRHVYQITGKGRTALAQGRALHGGGS